MMLLFCVVVVVVVFAVAVLLAIIVVPSSVIVTVLLCCHGRPWGCYLTVGLCACVTEGALAGGRSEGTKEAAPDSQFS